MPFTVEEFFQVFVRYNQAIWPAPIVAYLLGLLALAAALRPGAHSGRIVSSVLALFWIWMGAAYHLWQFARINPAAYAFGALFIAEGLLFLWQGVLEDRLRFAFRRRLLPTLGLLLIAYAAILYSMLGYLGGHGYPEAPLFGVAPCPTTIFTFGMLMLADRRMPRSLLVVPIAWSLIGGSAALLLHVPEDTGLLVAGLLGVPLLFRQRSSRRRPIS